MRNAMRVAALSALLLSIGSASFADKTINNYYNTPPPGQTATPPPPPTTTASPPPGCGANQLAHDTEDAGSVHVMSALLMLTPLAVVMLATNRYRRAN